MFLEDPESRHAHTSFTYLVFRIGRTPFSSVAKICLCERHRKPVISVFNIPFVDVAMESIASMEEFEVVT